MDIALGQTVKDRITGFSGVVIGKVNYISGCDQALLSHKAKDDGTFVESQWFDVQRLVVDSSQAVIVLDNGSTPGSDKPAPRR